MMYEQIIKPLQVKCIYGDLEFFVDNLYLFVKSPGRSSKVWIEAKFESILQFEFFAPLIWQKSKKKKVTPLLVIPEYGRRSKEDWIKFFNVKPFPFEFDGRLRELRFNVIEKKGKYFQIG